MSDNQPEIVLGQQGDDEWDVITRDLSQEEIPPLSQAAPKRLEHCYNLYAMLYARSVDIEGEGCVFDGYTTKVFQKHTKHGMPYYSQLLGLLKKMGCMEQLRRGGGGGTSRWLLQKWPTIELFDEVYEPGQTATSTRAHRVSHDRQMDQAMSALNERVLKIEAHLGIVS